MNRSLSLASAAGVGAAVMYLLDPVAGGRRRAELRDRSVWAYNRACRFLERATADLSNRLSGTVAELQHRDDWIFAGDDDALVDRVRTTFGRVVSHPGAVHVMIEHGAVRLDGAILADEIDPLIRAILNVDGVTSVDNRLQVRQLPGNVPGLQGEGSHPHRRVVPRSPAVRLALGMAGGMALAAGYMLTRRSAA